MGSGCDLVISFFPEELGSQGVMLVPAILFHFFQLISGTLISVKWTPKQEVTELPITKIDSLSQENSSDIKNSPTHIDFSVCWK